MRQSRTPDDPAEQRLIRSLRTYLRRRSVGRLACTYMVGGVGCYSAGNGAIPIRREGEPWCPVLGRNTSVQDDIVLQVVFAAWEAIGDEQAWIAASRGSGTQWGAAKLLHKLKADGARLLSAVRWADTPCPKNGSSGGPLRYLFLPAPISS